MLIAKPTHKRYANEKDFHLLKGGKSLGIFKVNQANLDDEINDLMGFVKETGADQCFLIWTARTGTCNVEVKI